MNAKNAWGRVALVGATGAMAALLAACGSTVQTTSVAHGASPEKVDRRFPDPGSAWLQGGTFVDVEQLRRIGRGLSKNQVRELIGTPHFGEGFFGVGAWDYLFNFRTGAGDEFVRCQYQVAFRDGLADQFFWREPACADWLKPRVSEVVRTVPAAAAPERLRLGADALFAFGKSGLEDIQPEGRRQLDELASQLQGRYRRLDSVTVVGHTDRLGGEAANQQLSVARAATVRDYLVQRGLPARVIRAFGEGEAKPVTQGCADTLAREQLIACLQPDRRVEIEVQGER